MCHWLFLISSLFFVSTYLKLPPEPALVRLCRSSPPLPSTRSRKSFRGSLRADLPKACGEPRGALGNFGQNWGAFSYQPLGPPSLRFQNCLCRPPCHLDGRVEPNALGDSISASTVISCPYVIWSILSDTSTIPRDGLGNFIQAHTYRNMYIYICICICTCIYIYMYNLNYSY